MTDTDSAVQAEVSIAADADTVYHLITDLPTLASLAEEAAAREWKKGDAARHTVVSIAHWRYDIEATADGCRVIERTWDRRPGWFRKPAGLATGVSDRAAANAEHIRLTLQRLKAKAEASQQLSG
jgi:hypothetical protein